MYIVLKLLLWYLVSVLILYAMDTHKSFLALSVLFTLLMLLGYSIGATVETVRHIRQIKKDSL